MERRVVEIHTHKKKNEADIKPPWSLKNLLKGIRRTIFLQDTSSNPERQDSAILPAQVANHSVGFGLSC